MDIKIIILIIILVIVGIFIYRRYKANFHSNLDCNSMHRSGDRHMCDIGLGICSNNTNKQKFTQCINSIGKCITAVRSVSKFNDIVSGDNNPYTLKTRTAYSDMTKDVLSCLASTRGIPSSIL